MSFLIFVIVIVALIVVHEFGHFVAAKLTGMRVDEFGLGYPPRAATLAKIGETEYTLNWIPFGGFVKIYGENGELGTAESQTGTKRSFVSKNRFAQAFVLVAGVTMNLLFAYVLITGALVAGTPRALSENEIAVARDMQLAVAAVLPGSPAEQTGLHQGDTIISARSLAGEWRAADPASFSNYIDASHGAEVTLTVHRNGQVDTHTVVAKEGLIEKNPFRYALGVEVATIGVVPLSFWAALVEGASLTWNATVLTAAGLGQFFYNVLTFSADFSQVAGPVGIAGVVGSASAQGLGSLFSIMAIISINLALINLVPVPALDGGRLLFVIIEGVLRRPIKASVTQTINAIGFAFLIFLMVVVTAHDIFKLVG